jgi:hypothetical protein
MRRITMNAAALAVTLGSLLGAAGTASAEPDVTPEQVAYTAISDTPETATAECTNFDAESTEPAVPTSHSALTSCSAATISSTSASSA